MAHEIDMSNNRENFAFTGDRNKIWHGLGQKLDPDATLKEWSEQAGLTHRVLEAPVMFDNGNEVVCYDKNKILYRSDTLFPLSVVSKGYEVVQPYEIINFFDSLINDLGFKMSTMGSLKDGKVVYALADLPMDFEIKGDLIKGYLLLGTSYNKSMATTAMITTTRVVCNNTLNIAVNSDYFSNSVVKVNHMTKFNPEEVKISLGLINKTWDDFTEKIELLSDYRFKGNEEHYELIKKIANVKEDIPLVDQERSTITLIDKLNKLYYEGKGQELESAKGTAWGLLNAVTEYADHHTKNTKEKVYSKLYGGNNNLKQKAYKQIMEYVASK